MRFISRNSGNEMMAFFECDAWLARDYRLASFITYKLRVEDTTTT